MERNNRGYSDSTPGIAYTYDRLGRQTSIVQGSGGSAITTTMTYNDQGQKLTETYSGGPLNTFSVTNGYDSFLRRTNNTVYWGTTNFTLITNNYDVASRLNMISDRTNAATYSYLANSPLLDHITFARSGTTEMTTSNQYDFLNRMISKASANWYPTMLDSHGYKYKDANQRTAVTNADGSYWLYAYDSLGQVTSGINYWPDASVVAGQQFGYNYDDIGNRTTSSAGGNEWGTERRYENYTANNLNQYTARSVPGAVDIIGTATNTATVTVNNLGTYRKGDYYRVQLPIDNSSGPILQAMTNVAALHQGASPDILTNINGNVLLPPAAQSFSYDADGNTANDSAWNYGWDAENRLLWMTNVSGLTATSRKRLDFQYDWRGRRISKIVSTNDGTTWYGISTNLFVYDGWNLMAEINGHSGTLIRSCMWGKDVRGLLSGVGGMSSLLRISTQTSNYFTCIDANGNICGLTAATTGSTIEKYEYDPFGALIRESGIISGLSPFLFSTKYLDNETSLIYYGYRYYHADLGRWLSRDPLAEGSCPNLFDAMDNDLIVKADILGLQASGVPTSASQAKSQCQECINSLGTTGNSGQPIISNNKLCATLIKGIINGDPTLSAMMKQFGGPNCPEPTFVCADCSTVPGLCAAFNPVDHTVIVCKDYLKPSNEGQLITHLIHELTHALQACAGPAKDCQSDVTAELQAYYCAGECDDFNTCLGRAIDSACLDGHCKNAQDVYSAYDTLQANWKNGPPKCFGPRPKAPVPQPPVAK